MGGGSEKTFSTEVEEIPGGCLLRLSGVIETNFDLAPHSAKAGGVVLLDLAGVDRINSYGVRQWSRAVRDLGADYLGFARCRPAMVMQLNMTTNFAGRGNVLSLYLPYVCDHCGEFTDSLLDVCAQQELVKAFSTPEVNCSACGNAATFDDVPRSYYSYISRVPPAPPPPLMKELLARLK